MQVCMRSHSIYWPFNDLGTHINSFLFIVRILTGVKRSSSSHGHKSSSKRSYLSDSQSSITHTGSPVNPMTAKALASKLNERNNLLNGNKKTNTQISSSAAAAISAMNSNSSVNDIPIPPLISIQTASSAAANRFKDQGQSELAMPMQNKFSHSKNFHEQNDGHCKPGSVKHHQKSNVSSKQQQQQQQHVNGTNSVHQSKMVKRN